MPHSANWYAGWYLLLAAFATGAILGIFFANDKFLGGYSSWPRRLARLGHIACAALGFLNILYAVAPISPTPWQHKTASIGLIVGGVTMPLACFLAAWKKPLKLFFPIPVAALVGSVVLILAS
jgi:hypothetical protein